jgi:hypothetical protein
VFLYASGKFHRNLHLSQSHGAKTPAPLIAGRHIQGVFDNVAIFCDAAGSSPSKDSCWLCIGRSGQGPTKECRDINNNNNNNNNSLVTIRATKDRWQMRNVLDSLSPVTDVSYSYKSRCPSSLTLRPKQIQSRIVAFSYLEFQTMDESQNPNDSEDSPSCASYC